MQPCTITSGMSEEDISSIKKKEITEKVRDSIDLYGDRPDLFASIIKLAIAVLELLINRIMLYLNAFSRYIQSNRNEIAALNIICTRPKDLTRKDLKDLRLTLDREGFTTQQLNTALYELTNEEIMADIISLIRRYAIGSTLISHEARIHRAVEKLRKKHNFSKQEQSWISRIEKYLLGESVMNIKVFDEDSRFASYGGFKKINKVFQNNLESIVLELNEYLYDDGGNVA